MPVACNNPQMTFLRDDYVLTKVAELASDRWQPPRNKSKFAQKVRLGGRADK